MAWTRVQLATAVETMSDIKNQRTLVNQALQMALEEFFEFHDWPYYLMQGVINTVASYETGTVTIANGSTALAGDSTVWTLAMVGRKIRIGSDNAYYVIKSFTNTTTMTLETPYQGDDVTDGTYVIYKDEYRIASDMDRYKTLRQAQNNLALVSLHPSAFDRRFPMPRNYNDPVYEVGVGTKLDSYTTGTISASSKTLTGSGTLWTTVEGLGRMASITIGNNVYTVKSVDSDTQITTYEDMGTIAGSTTYSIDLNNFVVQLYQIPNATRIIHYRYFRMPKPLANDSDLPDMPHAWHRLLLWGALVYLYLQKGDISESQGYAEAQWGKGLSNAMLKIGSFAADRKYYRRSQDGLNRINLDGLESANYDRRWSR